MEPLMLFKFVYARFFFITMVSLSFQRASRAGPVPTRLTMKPVITGRQMSTAQQVRDQVDHVTYELNSRLL